MAGGMDPDSTAPSEPGAAGSGEADAGSLGDATSCVEITSDSISPDVCPSARASSVAPFRSAPDFSSAISCWIVARSDRSIAIS